MSSRRLGYRSYYNRNYYINKRRFVPFLIIIILVMTCCILLYFNLTAGSQFRVQDLNPEHLGIYLQVGAEHDVPWYYLAAIDKVEGVGEDEVNKERSASISLHLVGMTSEEELSSYLKTYKADKSFIKKVERVSAGFENINKIYTDKIFPIAASNEYSYENGYGDARQYGGDRNHEGIDIMAEKGVPVLSVGDGAIEEVGWNQLGGWRIGIRSEDGVYYYYAHFSSYEGHPAKGDKVKMGELIGYVGDSGYGEEGTTGEFLPHLHFGMYTGNQKNLEAFNPFPFLQAWEYKNK